MMTDGDVPGLDVPTTEPECAQLLDAIPSGNPLNLILRRILFERDALKAEVELLRKRPTCEQCGGFLFSFCRACDDYQKH